MLGALDFFLPKTRRLSRAALLPDGIHPEEFASFRFWVVVLINSLLGFV